MTVMFAASLSCQIFLRAAFIFIRRLSTAVIVPVGNTNIKGLVLHTMADEMHYQCVMQRGSHTTHGWVPARAARVGCSVELKQFGNEWLVIAVFQETGMPLSMLKEHQLLHRASLPSVEAMK